MLGLPSTTAACLFDLDGVLTNSAQLHALAWGTVFDEYLLRLSEKTGWLFIPFDRDADYRDYVEGRSRLEGVHAFLASRGIALSEEAAHTLASRKGVVLAASLRGRGASALAGARRYLEAAGRAGIERAVISASTSTVPMLEQAGLATLVEEHVDAEVIRLRHLRSRPAADCLLFACLRLGVPPGDVVTFTQSPAGVAAGLSAGLTVIGVGDGRDAELLRGGGAHQVVPSLRALLDSRLLGERR
jgi:beta-phosphoglucomutase-like phosphatase (HAD superfamily)